MNVSFRTIRIAKRNPNYRFLGQDPGKDLPEEIFDVIAKRFPSYLTCSTLMHLERPKGNPELDELLSFAAQVGARIPKDASVKPVQITIRDCEVYAREEQLSAAFVECSLQNPVFDRFETIIKDDGLGLRYRLSKHSGNVDKLSFGAVTYLPHVIALRGGAKSRIESANLNGLRLVPVATDAPNGEWPRGVEPLYFVWARESLPPVDLPVFDNSGIVYPRDGRPKYIKRGCFLLDGYTVNACLKYRKIDLGAFDVALTFERFGGEQPCYQRLIFSQRAREVLEDCGMGPELMPVHVV